MPFSSVNVKPLTDTTIITLNVEINYYTGSFSYWYDIEEFIVPTKQQIVVRLDKTKTPPNALVHIIGFCATDTKALPLKLPEKTLGVPYKPEEAFAQTVQEVKFEFNATPRQLVSFGIHVKCDFKDATGKHHEYTKLCDPQVGNGPAT